MESTFITVSISQLTQGDSAEEKSSWISQKKGKLEPVVGESGVLSVTRSACYMLSFYVLEIRILDKCQPAGAA